MLLLLLSSLLIPSHRTHHQPQQRNRINTQKAQPGFGVEKKPATIHSKKQIKPREDFFFLYHYYDKIITLTNMNLRE